MAQDPTKLWFVTGGNAKLPKFITTLSLPAGYTCPGAKLCKSRADINDGHITDGPDTQFRCFAASAEAAFRSSRELRWHNRELLAQAKTRERMAQLILAGIPRRASVIRVHDSGDFFNQDYFDAWLDVARERQDVLFYAYTKSLNFWVVRLEEIPENMVLTASYGGNFDDLIVKHELRHSVVVFHPDEATQKGLRIDHDDRLAYTRGVDSFALLLHGTQPKDSDASVAIKRLKTENIKYAYGTGPQAVT
jgi:hypothetical protein